MEFFWSVFSGIWNEHRGMLRISSVQMRENVDQKNSECEHFSGSVADVNKNHRILETYLEHRRTYTMGLYLRK